jgi:hypothetical protein
MQDMLDALTDLKAHEPHPYSERIARLYALDISALEAAINLARARAEHEKYKSDPERNVLTGRALYEAQRAFDALMSESTA